MYAVNGGECRTERRKREETIKGRKQGLTERRETTKQADQLVEVGGRQRMTSEG